MAAQLNPLIPAEAGIQKIICNRLQARLWIPALRRDEREVRAVIPARSNPRVKIEHDRALYIKRGPHPIGQKLAQIRPRRLM